MPKLVWKDICIVFAGQLDSKEREKLIVEHLEATVFNIYVPGISKITLTLDPYHHNLFILFSKNYSKRWLMKDPTGDTILHTAIKYYQLGLFYSLFKAKIAINNETIYPFRFLLNIGDHNNNTILHLLAMKNCSFTLKFILEINSMTGTFNPYVLNNENKTFVELLSEKALNDLGPILLKQHCFMGLNIIHKISFNNRNNESVLSFVMGSAINYDEMPDNYHLIHSLEDMLAFGSDSELFSSHENDLRLGITRLTQIYKAIESKQEGRQIFLLNVGDIEGIYQYIHAKLSNIQTNPFVTLSGDHFSNNNVIYVSQTKAIVTEQMKSIDQLNQYLIWKNQQPMKLWDRLTTGYTGAAFIYLLLILSQTMLMLTIFYLAGVKLNYLWTPASIIILFYMMVIDAVVMHAFYVGDLKGHGNNIYADAELLKSLKEFMEVVQKNHPNMLDILPILKKHTRPTIADIISDINNVRGQHEEYTKRLERLPDLYRVPKIEDYRRLTLWQKIEEEMSSCPVTKPVITKHPCHFDRRAGR